jgi:hypothetical protein
MTELALYISVIVNIYLVIRLEREKFKSRIYKAGFESSLELWNKNRK